MTEKEDPVEREYRENVGRDPRNLPEDHPDRWQWEYRGTKEEREALAERLGLDDPEEPPSQEEALF